MIEAIKDPMGMAIAEFYDKGKGSRLIVESPDFDDDEICLNTLFRNFKSMPLIERKALELAEGRILDVGAASGCHSLALQDMGKKVTAIDISSLSVDTMKKRGVIDARLLDFFDKSFDEKFDTIIILMNGLGIAGNLIRLPMLFDRAKSLLNPGGCILADSTDIRYVFENEDGSMDIDLNSSYYGELTYKMRYRGVVGEEFSWLYVDYSTLAAYAEAQGMNCDLVVEGEHYDYLAKIY